ncbi:MAG: tetratricopeptide repeat protein [Bryobacteraceae bacterium]|nr:tetratricopeptide repeat protein [Bryobacteraceae bacterium]
MQVLAIDAVAWGALNRLLDIALDLPAAERSDWVECLGPEYEQLKPRLRDLLQRAEQEGAGGILDTIPKIGDEFTVNGDADRAAHAPGDAIGLYRLERELGEGGMGTVWLAHRPDGFINRPVALKLPRGSWRRNALAERLAREREILAGLNHPHIARLYDAGLTADGQPYLALEYVDGLRIDEYCRQANLDVKGRLSVFLQVLSAVAYAHSQLVVHRDIKPSNILVTNDGQARLLDFGIAKLLEQGQARETELTELSGRALTPDFASPEQIAGKPVGAASDVYSLGVVLFMLVTEGRPYRLKRDSRASLEDAILHAEPPRPSEAAAEPSFRKSLRGDLDWIVLKSLAKEPEQRYPSAAALQADLVRYLRHEPVEAGPPSAAYRMTKFVRRHRLAVASAVLVTLALIGGLFGATVGLLRARAAEAEARTEAATAERVSAFLVDLFQTSTPEEAKGRELTAREILERGAARVHDQLADEPLVKARLLRTIGYVYTNLGLYPQAGPFLEEAIKLARSLGNRGRHELAIALHRQANLHRLTGDVTRAEAEFREAIAILESAVGPSHPDLGPALNSLAILVRSRDPEEALVIYRRAYDLLVAEHGEPNGEAGVVLSNIGSLHLRARRWREAQDNLEKALPLVIWFHGENDHRVGGVAGNLAIVHKELGNYERALELSRQDLDLSSRVLGPTHPAIGAIWLNLARVTARMGDEQEALAQTEQALEIFRRHLPPSHALRVTAENTRGLSLFRLGQRAEARRVWDELLTVSSESVDARKSLLTTRLMLAEFHGLSNRFEESLALARGVLADPLIATDPHLEAEARWVTACALARSGSFEEADAESRQALHLHATTAPTLEPVTLFAHAKYLACAGDEQRSVQLLARAVEQGFRDAAVLTDPAFAALHPRSDFAPVAAAIPASDRSR